MLRRKQNHEAGEKPEYPRTRDAVALHKARVLPVANRANGGYAEREDPIRRPENEIDRIGGQQNCGDDPLHDRPSKSCAARSFIRLSVAELRVLPCGMGRRPRWTRCG